MDITRLKGDPQLDVDGVWYEVADGLAIKVARMDNDRYEAYLRKHARTRQLSVRRLVGEDVEEGLRPIVLKAMARHILVDWRNLEEPDENGTLQEVPYSPEKAEQLLTDIKAFFRLVLEVSQDATLFRQQEVTDAAGN